MLYALHHSTYRNEQQIKNSKDCGCFYCKLTITTDNGSEFAEHQWISRQLGGVPVYFTDSYSSWQKGAIENTNKLIRQYIPKGANINNITDALITKIQKKINRRPREKLNFSTPMKEFFKHYS